MTINYDTRYDLKEETLRAGENIDRKEPSRGCGGQRRSLVRRWCRTWELKDDKELVLQREEGRTLWQNLWVRCGNLCCCCFLGTSNEGASGFDDVLSLPNDKTSTTWEWVGCPLFKGKSMDWVGAVPHQQCNTSQGIWGKSRCYRASEHQKRQLRNRAWLARSMGSLW